MNHPFGKHVTQLSWQKYHLIRRQIHTILRELSECTIISKNIVVPSPLVQRILYCEEFALQILTQWYTVSMRGSWRLFGEKGFFPKFSKRNLLWTYIKNEIHEFSMKKDCSDLQEKRESVILRGVSLFLFLW